MFWFLYHQYKRTIFVTTFYVIYRGTQVKERDISWVLTVPAIWSDGSKQFMREAAEMV